MQETEFEIMKEIAQLLKQKGFEGSDADLETSLFEYGWCVQQAENEGFNAYFFNGTKIYDGWINESLSGETWITDHLEDINEYSGMSYTIEDLNTLTIGVISDIISYLGYADFINYWCGPKTLSEFLQQLKRN